MKTGSNPALIGNSYCICLKQLRKKLKSRFESPNDNKFGTNAIAIDIKFQNFSMGSANSFCAR